MQAYLNEILPILRDALSSAATDHGQDPLFHIACLLLQASGCSIPAVLAEVVDVQSLAMKRVLENRSHLPVMNMKENDKGQVTSDANPTNASLNPTNEPVLRFTRVDGGHLTCCREEKQTITSGWDKSQRYATFVSPTLGQYQIEGDSASTAPASASDTMYDNSRQDDTPSRISQQQPR